MYGDKEIKMSPDRRCLKSFGGELSLEEYHKYSGKDNYYNIIQPNIIQLQNTFRDSKIDTKYNDSDLILYRKNPLKNKNNNIKNYINVN